MCLQPSWRLKGQEVSAVNDYVVSGGITQFEWKPSANQWKASAYVASEWQVHKDLKLKGRMELLGSNEGASGRFEAGAATTPSGIAA